MVAGVASMGKNDSQVGSQPSAGTGGALAGHWRGTGDALGGHLHFIWDTQESLVFHFNYSPYSLVPLSFTLLSHMGHFVSRVSNELFITDLPGLGGQL